MARKITVGMSVLVTTMARTDAVGKVMQVTGGGYTVRLPNWQADGVHLDVYARTDEVETGHGRAAVCRCPFCHGYRLGVSDGGRAPLGRSRR